MDCHYLAGELQNPDIGETFSLELKHHLYGWELDLSADYHKCVGSL